MFIVHEEDDFHVNVVLKFPRFAVVIDESCGVLCQDEVENPE